MTGFIVNFLNSGHFFLLLLGLLALWLIYRKLTKFGRCPVCKKGKLQEVEAIPQSIEQHIYSGSEGHHASMQTIVKVKYHCGHCGESIETTENR